MNIESRTILLVEDNPDDVFIFKRAWTQAGIRNPLHVVTDGQEAVDYLSGEGAFTDRARYPLPLAILLDLKLSFKSGLAVLEWMQNRPHLADISVVVLTSSAEPRDILRAYQLGARSYLTKPPRATTLTELMSALRRIATEDFQLTEDKFRDLPQPH
jgi:CheY-like chemotaxis protein